MQLLYHVSQAQLSAGQVLQPGAWGRAVRQFRRNGRALTDLDDAKNLAWESCLETARRVLAHPTRHRAWIAYLLARPSRVRRRFVHALERTQLSTKSRWRPESPMFTADYDLITDAGDEPFVDTWVDRAIRYWTSAPQGIAEVLVGGDVRVLRSVLK